MTQFLLNTAQQHNILLHPISLRRSVTSWHILHRVKGGFTQLFCCGHLSVNKRDSTCHLFTLQHKRFGCQCDSWREKRRIQDSSGFEPALRMAPVPGREWRSGRTQSVLAFGSWYVGHLSLLIQTTCYNVSPFSYHVSFQLIMSPTVPVGGPVTIRSDIHLGENYAMIALSFFTCWWHSVIHTWFWGTRCTLC